MKFKNHFTYHIGKEEMLTAVFPDSVLPSGYINKGRCGIGGTTLEIKNVNRCSIITVPNISIIKGKKAQHPELDIVYGDIPYEEVYHYLLYRKIGHKIMTTPEGIKKIMWAAQQLSITGLLMNEWFLMLDEAHTFISEHYREDILLPFKYFFDWKHKCIITATPYFFTDPRMAQLDYHDVIINESIGEITLVKARSVTATLHYILKNPNAFPANVHIFYNSVTEIAKAVNRAELVDCSIFCADDRLHTNMAKLGELQHLYCKQPDESNFKKFNFYTSKYFEGWDMYDTDATLILVTDIYREHTKVGVADKGVQAFGRLRGKKGTVESAIPSQLIHITNDIGNKEMKSLEEIVGQFKICAESIIEHANLYSTDGNGVIKFKNPNLKLFADIEEITHLSTLNYMKLDQQINEAAKGECYQHIDFINEAWNTKYTTNRQTSNLLTETTTSIKRKSAATQLREDYEAIIEARKDLANGIFFLGESVEQVVRKTNPLAYDAARFVDAKTMQDLKFTPSKVKQQVILAGNDYAESKLLKILDNSFKVGHSYTNEYITAALQRMYNILGLKTKAGLIQTALPKQLAASGRFEIKPCKLYDSKGTLVNGFKILRKQFELSTAA